ncbi:hypothetical protein [Pseudarthrobacter sp. S9]|uniref:hypothetical protein n=1 Tax=Pseudarthrobacter sp. S9 TaxID=3418421 RepID=UPI003D08B1FD
MKFQPVVRAAAAVAIAVAGSFWAVPALAEAGVAEPAPAEAWVAERAPATTVLAAPPATPTPSTSVAEASSPATAAAPSPATAAAPAVSDAGLAPAVNDAGLAEAIRRDLGMTLEGFNAAGEQAKRAADAVPFLRGLPGYVGISLKDGKITVEGSGTQLQARVDELNQAGPADFVLAAPSAAAPAGPSAAAPAGPAAAAAGPAAAAAVPAAPSAAELVASSTDQLFEAYVREVGPAGLQAVAYADGHFVVRTGGFNTPEAGLPLALDKQLPTGSSATPAAAIPAAAPGKISPADFVARYANVQLEKGAPIKTEEDFFGGQGYVIDKSAICSAGFGAYSPDGLPVVLTAGHCAGDGAAKAAEIESPSSAPAGGSTTPLTRPLASLGSFGFSQFGGPSNSWITGTETSPGNVGTDIAVIESLRTGVNVQPAATRWSLSAADDPANPGPTAVKIIGMLSPFQGQDVCRSGRTSGWSCGTVKELGTYVVGGGTSITNPADLRAFRGFLSTDVQSSGGDSGGPWISGNYAVGTHSAGDAPPAPGQPVENFAIATALEDSITQIPGGVQLQLFLNKPELVAPANGATFTAGTLITGRVPAAPASAVAANSKVRITVAGQQPDQQPLEVPVDAAGNWSFAAPSSTGRFQFSAETVNGFSRSGAASLSITVSDLVAPVITTPAEGVALHAVDRIDGTGTPGLTVLLSGDVTGSDTVSADGHWSINVAGPPAFGELSVGAVQRSPGHVDSPSTTRSFTVTPPAPAVSTVQDGLHFPHDAVPQRISGTGLAGAVVAVRIDGADAGQTASNGSWSVPFPAGLAAGSHTLSVSQSVDGVTSAQAEITFVIDPVPVVAPAAAVAPAAGSGQLAATGAGTLLPAGAIGAGVLLLGGVALVVARPRSRR